ncbi:uncharacterized protein [Apostichopus japonicus]|uniref:uncharacterized protein n=1 Tax=Stichopus japonicus TaxID=307972 RepID=UPI003AB514C0
MKMAQNVLHSHLKKIRNDAKKRLYKYEAPKWAEDLSWKPRFKIDLCQMNTPIHRWYLPQIPDAFEVYVKRDDMTGGATSGHKIRRLEFNLAEALEEDCDTVIGCGAVTSNGCRTLAVSGKELGFNVHLCMSYCNTTKENILPFHGNHYLDRLLGANLHINTESTLTNSSKKRHEISRQLCSEGYSPYVVGFNEPGDVGLFGYIDCFAELIKQGVTENFSDLIFTCATGMTTAAFIIGNDRNGGKLRLHSLSADYNEVDTIKMVIGLLKDVGFLPEDYKEKEFSSLINIVEESLLPEYNVITDEHIDFVSETAKSTGILLDPVYTGKSAYHMVKKLQTAPETFQGKKILFYNTGSVIGLMSETLFRAVSDSP